MLYILYIATQCIACTVTICILINSYAVNALAAYQNCVCLIMYITKLVDEKLPQNTLLSVLD